jgi:energy-coupling factor transporter transmembrane protein EcfT
MKERITIFQYRRGGSVLHKIPGLPKMALALSLSAIIMLLPFYAAAGGIVVLALTATLCGFTPKEQLADIKPVLFYAAFLCLISFFSNPPFPDFRYGLYILRLLLVMQLSALFFRTTTSTEIKEAIRSLEAKIRGAIKKLPFTKNISAEPKFWISLALTLCFIPELFELWERLNRAYKARNGRGGLKKIRVLLISLFSLSFCCAERKARALASRKIV